MRVRSKLGWVGLAIVVVCGLAFASGWFGGLVGAGITLWACAVFARPTQAALLTTVVGAAKASRGVHLSSAVGELVLATVVFVCTGAGASSRSDRERKETDRVAAVKTEETRKATVAHNDNLRAHSSEAISRATRIVSDAKGALQKGDYAGAQGYVDAANEIIGPYQKLNPPVRQMMSLFAEAHEVETNASALGAVKKALSDGPAKLAEAAASAKDKEYIAADKIYGELVSALVVPAGAEEFVPASDVKKLRTQVEAKRRAIAAGVKKEEAQIAAAEVYVTLCGERPVLSPWDGEVIGLERHIKETANDPDSIDAEKCTNPVMTEKHCWVSTCNVRGKNGFGALILLRKTYSFSKLGIEEVRR